MPKYSAEEIRKGVKELVAEITERKPSEISDTAQFGADLGIDSLMASELMVTMERKYKIKIPEEEFAKIRNVNEAVTACQRHVATASA